MAQHREYHQQCLFIDWCKLYSNHPEFEGLDLMFSVPNGAYLKGGASQGDKLAKEGVRKGVPDLFLPVPTRLHHGLFIEMKANEIRDVNNKIVKRKGVTSKDQKKWIKRLNAIGYLAIVCYGKNEAVEAIYKYFGVKGLIK